MEPNLNATIAASATIWETSRRRNAQGNAAAARFDPHIGMATPEALPWFDWPLVKAPGDGVKR